MLVKEKKVGSTNMFIWLIMLLEVSHTLSTMLILVNSFRQGQTKWELTLHRYTYLIPSKIIFWYSLFLICRYILYLACFARNMLST